MMLLVLLVLLVLLLLLLPAVLLLLLLVLVVLPSSLLPLLLWPLPALYTFLMLPPPLPLLPMLRILSCDPAKNKGKDGGTARMGQHRGQRSKTTYTAIPL